MFAAFFHINFAAVWPIKPTNPAKSSIQKSKNCQGTRVRIAPNDTCSTLGQSSKCSRICARRKLSKDHGMSSIHCIHWTTKCTICKYIYLSMIAHVNILAVLAWYIGASLCFLVMCIYDNLHSSSSKISCVQCPKERHKISQTTRQPASTGTSEGNILSTLTYSYLRKL